jgi:hypothetical protein
MSSGRDYTKYQKKVIDRYYEHHDTIVLSRLGELVGDIALAEGNAKKLESLWAKAAAQLAHVKGLPPAEVARVLAAKDAAGLAALIARAAR